MKNRPYVKLYHKRVLINPITKDKPYLHKPVAAPSLGSKYHKTHSMYMISVRAQRLFQENEARKMTAI